MFNNELYKILEDRFGVERMMSFAEIMAARHDLLFADSEESINGEDFERDWWDNKFADLCSISKDMQSVEGILTILHQKGYSSILDVKNRNDFEDENTTQL